MLPEMNKWKSLRNFLVKKLLLVIESNSELNG